MAKSRLSYRPIRPEEVETSAAIIVRAFNEMEEKTGVPKTPGVDAVAARLQEYVNDTGIPSMLYGGFLDDEQVGFFMLRKLGIDQETWEICMLAVDPEYQENGYGRKLITFALQKVMDFNGVLAVCAVTEGNEIALNLFADQGFVCEASGIPVSEGLSIWMLRKDMKNASAACAARREFPEEYADENGEGCGGSCGGCSGSCS